MTAWSSVMTTRIRASPSGATVTPQRQLRDHDSSSLRTGTDRDGAIPRAQPLAHAQDPQVRAPVPIAPGLREALAVVGDRQPDRAAGMPERHAGSPRVGVLQAVVERLL